MEGYVRVDNQPHESMPKKEVHRTLVPRAGEFIRWESVNK